MSIDFRFPWQSERLVFSVGEKRPGSSLDRELIGVKKARLRSEVPGIERPISRELPQWCFEGRKYRLIRVLGKGGSGIVVSGINPDGYAVALKVNFGPSEREFRILEKLSKDTDAATLVENSITPLLISGKAPVSELEAGLAALSPGSRKFRGEEARVLVFPLYHCAMTHGIRQGVFSLSSLQRFISQMVVALAFLKKRQIVHCDIKPENVLLAGAVCGSLLSDFGLSCDLSRGPIASHQLATVGYRPPEVLLEKGGYDHSLDMWSLGCVVFEAMFRAPLFPGKNREEMLDLIIDEIGLSEFALTNYSYKGDCPGLEEMLLGSDSRGGRLVGLDLKLSIKGCHRDVIDDLIDLLKGLLTEDPAERLTAEQVANHRFLNQRID